MARTLTAKVLPYLEAIEAAHRAGESWKDICGLVESVTDTRFRSPVCFSNAVRRARKGVNDGRLWVEQRPLSGMAASSALSGKSATPAPYGTRKSLS
ncbi:MAG: hypothetical protein ACP5D5_10055, partial [Acidithiobacillus sp.]|uniref:hypothetical protein n=1 Tax=Acidithiobacillus sp. TaxID=1872118 RepID=UPI003D07B37C